VSEAIIKRSILGSMSGLGGARSRAAAQVVRFSSLADSLRGRDAASPSPTSSFSLSTGRGEAERRSPIRFKAMD